MRSRYTIKSDMQCAIIMKYSSVSFSCVLLFEVLCRTCERDAHVWWVCSSLPGIHGKSAGSLLEESEMEEARISQIAGKKNEGAASCPRGTQPFEGQ